MIQRPMGALEPLPLTRLRAGQTVIRQGQPAPDLWVVAGGALCASVVSPEGQEIILDVLGPGDAVGEPYGSASSCTVTASCESRLRAARPDEVANLLSVRARRAAELACELAWLDTPARVASRLRDLAARFGRPVPGGSIITLRLTQDELALMCGAARESVNRALRSLQARGAVRTVSRGRYLIVGAGAPVQAGSEPDPSWRRIRLHEEQYEPRPRTGRPHLRQA